MFSETGTNPDQEIFHPLKIILIQFMDSSETKVSIKKFNPHRPPSDTVVISGLANIFSPSGFGSREVNR